MEQGTWLPHFPSLGQFRVAHGAAAEAVIHFLAALAGGPFRFRPSAGTFFQLLDYSAINDAPDYELCERWTKQHGIASIPVSIFYQHPPQNERVLRFCFAKSDDMLLQAAEILCKI